MAVGGADGVSVGEARPGALLNETNVCLAGGTYTGTSTLRAINLSVFTVREVAKGALFDGYAGLEFGVADTDLNDGTDDFSGSYDSRTFSIGVGYVRDHELSGFSFRNYLTLDFASTQQSAFTLVSPTAADVAVAQQTTNVLSLRVQPEFKMSGVGDDSELRIMPSVVCERTSTTGAADDNACGAGLAFDLTTLADSGGTFTLAAGAERIGNATNTNARLA